MRIVVAALAVVGFSAAAFAQTPQTPAPSGAAPASPPPAASPAQSVPAASTPQVDCRGNARSKGLRGQDMRDSVAVCMAEQRLACTKEAVEKKIVGKERRAFIRSCIGRPAGRKNKS